MNLSSLKLHPLQFFILTEWYPKSIVAGYLLAYVFQLGECDISSVLNPLLYVFLLTFL